MSGTRRRDARNRGEGGPSGELVGVNRRRIGGEPRRRCDWAGESEIVAANRENLGGMVSPVREISVSGGRLVHGMRWGARHVGDRWQRRTGVRQASGGSAGPERWQTRSWSQGMWVPARCPDALVGPTYPAPAGPLLEPEGGVGWGLDEREPAAVRAAREVGEGD